MLIRTSFVEDVEARVSRQKKKKKKSQPHEGKDRKSPRTPQRLPNFTDEVW